MTAEPIPGELTAACEAVRPATAADAVAGIQPALVASPASTQECSGLLRAAAALGLAVVPRGTGSRLHWGYPPERVDLVVETTRLDQVLEHAAGDLVATVQAGVRLERLAEVLSSAGQRLALDPHPLRPSPTALRHPAAAHSTGGPMADLPAAARGTVGGVLATGAAGPLRLRYGTGRDLLLGLTVVRADGTVAKSGGKVVKNVAGYDLGKLFAGSRGTLGLITQATFRLHPVPAAAAYVTARCAGAVDACQVLAAATDSPVAPVAAEIDWPADGEPVQVAIALEGDPAGVAERAMTLADLVRQSAGRDAEPEVVPDPPQWWGAGPAAQPDGTVLQVAFWPGDLALVLAEIRAGARAAGLDPRVGGSAAAGVLHAALPADGDPGVIAAFVAVLRGAAGPGQPGSAEGPPARASVVVLHAPAAVGALVDMFGPIPSLALMRSVKHQFDPGRMLSPGRFAGGI
jgi:glycolate oxidase FAD binding subunit